MAVARVTDVRPQLEGDGGEPGRIRNAGKRNGAEGRNRSRDDKMVAKNLKKGIIPALYLLKDWFMVYGSRP